MFKHRPLKWTSFNIWLVKLFDGVLQRPFTKFREPAATRNPHGSGFNAVGLAVKTRSGAWPSVEIGFDVIRTRQKRGQVCSGVAVGTAVVAGVGATAALHVQVVQTGRHPCGHAHELRHCGPSYTKPFPDLQLVTVGLNNSSQVSACPSAVEPTSQPPQSASKTISRYFRNDSGTVDSHDCSLRSRTCT